MSKPKHTPGPWEFYDPTSTDKRYWIEHPASGESIADIHIVGVGKSQAKANANLIACAPELLEISEQMVSALDGVIRAFDKKGKSLPSKSMQEDFISWVNVIRKARG